MYTRKQSHGTFNAQNVDKSLANPKKAWGASHRHLAFIEEVLLLFKEMYTRKQSHGTLNAQNAKE